jgi:hypothetical protein
MLPKLRYHKQGAAVISKLLEKGSISEDDYIDLTGLDIGRKLLETNIFALRFRSGRVTFQSTVVKRFCEEKQSIWKGIKKEREDEGDKKSMETRRGWLA